MGGCFNAQFNNNNGDSKIFLGGLGMIEQKFVMGVSKKLNNFSFLYIQLPYYIQ